MQTNINKSIEKKTNNSNALIDEMLLTNQEIFNKLIIENSKRKEKLFITVREIDLIKEIEKNLINLIEMCPPVKAKEILNEIGSVYK